MSTQATAHFDASSVFVQERRAAITHMGSDQEFRGQSLAWMAASCPHQYSYNFTWLGRPVIQYPQDLLALQEIIWRTKPTLIIETGIAHGGSLVFSASMLQLIGEAGRVIGVDIDIRAHNRAAIEAHPMFDRIELIEGSSVDAGVVQQIAQASGPEDRVMVILDSHHSHEHVLSELRAYGPMVTRDCYLVVLDTIIEDLPKGVLKDDRWQRGNSPKTAVHAYLQESQRFVIDAALNDKLMISVAPDGYLLCQQ